MIRGFNVGRTLSGAERAWAAGSRRPRVVFALLASLVVILYFVIVPTSEWVSWLPSNEPPPNASISPLRGSQPGPIGPLLVELKSNFTQAWRTHSSGPAPVPIYVGPALTPDQKTRYRHLRTPTAKMSPTGLPSSPKYMLTAILKDVAAQLPDLLNTIAVVTSFLGPEHVSISIIEGPSNDASAAILEHVLRPLLSHLGVPRSSVRIETDSERIDWSHENRIEKLAKLRNKALEPLWLDSDTKYLAATPPGKRRTVGIDVAAVVFFNDVFLQPSDVLELLHQHFASSGGHFGTGITAAWDWMERDPAYFYDVWVARTIDTGDLFYPIDNPWWEPSDAILSTSPASLEKFNTLSPFQVYSAWNGMAVLSPTPFRPPYNVRFRRSFVSRDECAASECSLLASDFWKYGHGRVQVVPAVQLAYSRGVALQTAQRLRKRQTRLGWNNGVPPREYDKPITWTKQPPTKVRCHAWPEVHGLSANVWETTQWVPPYVM